MPGGRVQDTIYMNMKLGYIVDESRVQGTFGFGKLYKAFKVGTNLKLSESNPGSGKGKHRDGWLGGGLLHPERMEILNPGDCSRVNCPPPKKKSDTKLFFWGGAAQPRRRLLNSKEGV